MIVNPFISFPVAGFSNESQAIFSKMTGLTNTQKIHMARFIDRQHANGNASLFSAFQCYALTGNSTINWWGTSPNATINGASVTAGYGAVLDGIDDYIDTGFNPTVSGGSNFTVSDSFAGVFLKRNGTAGVGGLLGVQDGASNRFTLAQNSNLSVRANAATASTYATETAFLPGSLYFGYRSPSLTGIMINSRQLSLANNAATAVPNRNFDIGCNNSSGTRSIFMSIDVACFVAGKFVGFKFQEFYNDLIIMLIGLEGVKYPSWVQLGIEIAGQSNAEGQTLDVPSAGNIGPITVGTSPVYTAYMKTAGTTYPVLQYTTDPGTRTNRGNIFGIELTLAKGILTSTNKDIYLGKTAVSGAPIYQEPAASDFNILSNELYPTLRDEIKNLADKIHTLGKAPLIILVWIQGERDANSVEAANWNNNFNNIINQLSIDNAGIQYIILNLLSTNITAGGVDPTGLNTVRSQQQLYKNNHSNTFLIDMTQFALSVDNLHFSGSGYEAAGTSYANSIISNILT